MVDPAAIFPLMVIVTMAPVASAQSQPECSDAVPEQRDPDAFFAVMTSTATGGSDGTVGIHLPTKGDDLAYAIVSRLRFDGREVVWTEGPFAANPGEYVAWDLEVAADRIVTDAQYTWLSTLSVYVDLYRSGERTKRERAGYARVAFGRDGTALIMLPDEARELAPGDVWELGAEARVGAVDIADVPRPPRPEGRIDGPKSEEVTP